MHVQNNIWMKAKIQLYGLLMAPLISIVLKSLDFVSTKGRGDSFKIPTDYFEEKKQISWKGLVCKKNIE